MGCVRGQWAAGQPPWVYDEKPNGGQSLLKRSTGGASPAGVAAADEIEEAYALTQKQMQAVFAAASPVPIMSTR